MQALEKRYRRELGIAMLAYVIVMLMVWPLVRSTDSSALRVLVCVTRCCRWPTSCARCCAMCATATSCSGACT